MRNSNFDLFVIAAAGCGALALAVSIFWLGGFLAVGILGLLIGFIATRIDLEKEGVVGGGQTTGLYAQQREIQRDMSRSEIAAHASEVRSFRQPLLVAKLFAAAFVVTAIIGLFLS